MAITLAALKTELQTDPTGLGYAPFIALGAMWKMAGLLNAPTPSIQILRGLVKTWEILAATDVTEYNALAALQKDVYGKLLSVGEIDTTDAAIQGIVTALFAAGTTTRTNLLARLRRNGSRAEQLFGTGVSVTSADCARALES